MSKYDKMTNDNFDVYLREVIDDEYSYHPSDILGIPGIYEVLSEHFNNEVLDRWEANQPNEDEDDDDDEDDDTPNP